MEFAKLWEPGFAGVELFNACLLRHMFGKHFHETYTIGFNQGGQGCFLHRGQMHCAYPGSFNLINPGEVHTGQAASEAGWRFCNIYVSVSHVQQSLAQLEWNDAALPVFSESVIWDQPLQLAFQQLFQALTQPTAQLEQQSLMLQVMFRLLREHAQPRSSWQLAENAERSSRSETKAVSLVRAYLEAHCSEPIAIDTLAKLAGLSPYYLIRQFHQQVGMPPHRYQQQWQLLRVKRALRNPKPLSEVAMEHGFYDQSHLNRTFKRTFGVTPGQYQKGNLIQYS